MFIIGLIFLLTSGLSASGENSFSDFENLQTAESFSIYIQEYLQSENANLSEQCSKELDQYSKALPFKLWALKMLDARSRRPAGLLSGNAGDLGAFHQCLNIRGNTTEGTIYGKYCLGSLDFRTKQKQSLNDSSNFEKNTHSYSTLYNRDVNPMLNSEHIERSIRLEILYAVCSPSSCSAAELQDFYSSKNLNVHLTDELCQVKNTENETNTAKDATITFLWIIFGVMQASTLYDLVLYCANKKPILNLFVSFSIMKNGKALLNNTDTFSNLSCLHGIRAMSLMWVIISHRYYLYSRFPLLNYSDYSKSLKSLRSMYVLEAEVAMDTFLVVNGLLLSYTYMKSLAAGAKFNILKYYLRAYLCSASVLAVTVLVYAALLKDLGTGPYWGPVSEHLVKPCEKYWWSALLYIQNYVNPLEMCVEQSWYLSVDMQLFILSPILLIPLAKKPKLTLISVAILALMSVVSSSLILWLYEIPGTSVAGSTIVKEDKYMSYVYQPTHTRASPWLIGFILGYFIYHSEIHRINIKIRNSTHLKLIALGLWGVTLAIMVGCVYAPYNIITEEYDKLRSTLYFSLVKPVWSIMLTWIIYACINGLGGPVNWLLSLPVLQFVSKLSFSMYLMHVLVTSLSTLTSSAVLEFGEIDMLYRFWGDFYYALFVSVLWALAFQYPVVNLCNIIFKEDTKVPEKSDNHNEKVKESA